MCEILYPIRAIATAPSHIYRETTEHLLQRLHYNTPVEALLKYLQGLAGSERGQHCTWGADSLHSLQQVLNMTSIGPTPVSSATPEVPCPVCGVYFGSNLAMKIHRTRMHGEASLARKPDNADSRRSVEVQHHSLDGMPTCRHCKHRLTTWNNFRSHILNSCTVLHRRPTTLADDSAANAQDSEHILEAAPLPNQGSDPSGPAWPSAVRPQSLFVGPIFSRPEVGELLGTPRWKRVLKLKGVSKELQHHCVICHQWTASGGIKRHVRAMHPAAWTLTLPRMRVAARWLKWRLSPA